MGGAPYRGGRAVAGHEGSIGRPSPGLSFRRIPVDRPTSVSRGYGRRMSERSAAQLDRRGVVWGCLGVAVLLALTFLGSGQLVWFDAALVGYLFGLLFATFGIIYRYTVWLRRPPTAMLNRRGWDAFRARRLRNAAALPGLV